MNKPPRAETNIIVGATVYPFPARSLDGFPQAKPFLEHLLARNRIAPATAVQYVKIAARLWRLRRMYRESPHVNERTVSRAFRRWWLEAYTELTAPVVQALGAALPVRAAVAWLRRSSIVPPYPAKHVPLPRLPGTELVGRSLEQVVGRPQYADDAPTLSLVRPDEAPPQPQWRPAPDVWTLHVPASASVPAHTDPCADCTVIDLTAAQLAVMGSAFTKAWGQIDLNTLAMDSFLFGEPPPDFTGEVVRKPTAGKLLAFVPEGALAENIVQLGGVVARTSREFEELLGADVPETIVISRSEWEKSYAGLGEFLRVVEEKWSRAETPDVHASAEHQPSA